ncbi:hypothetical protein [Collimonas sp.]|uniref:hypothetical protein n=1 Tax=Collimonas sp. TaxID=1963772 RepID=UPI002C880FFF|nr:hypothetical protein [Collimonas sp.]HWW08594.1 hypothetical protein [Collimonas sp.]
MKNIHALMLAVSALLCINLAQAQTATSAEGAVIAPAGSAGVNATATTSVASPSDPLVQKRQADSDAKTEYKVKKKIAKANMKIEKAEAKSDLKQEKLESKDARDKAMASDPIPK